LIRPFEHGILRRSGALVCSSASYAAGSELVQAYRRKLHIVPFGIDLAPYLHPEPAVLAHAERLLAEHGQPLWLCVGRLVYYKGLHNAMAALAHVPGKLLIVGEGPLRASLQNLASQQRVADRVVWLGRAGTEELAGAYRAATALWFPSNARSEAFGLVQVEAMASGCPVLNTTIVHSGVSWVSRHEESGLTIAVDDPAALAQASQRLLSEPELRTRLGRQARSRACQHFDQRLMAERTLNIYRTLLGRRGRTVWTVPPQQLVEVA
jgi:rhamnosyl/mannosyltransferase